MRPSATEVRATNDNHQAWAPLLDLAAREVFELMLGCHLSAPATGEDPPLNITAMVGLAGKLCGILSLRCDRTSATLMASKMLGVDPDKVGHEMSDALGEISNMVAGNFKDKISGLREGCMLSVPTVITGTDYSLHSQAESPGIEARLLFEGLPIVLSLQIRS